MKAKKINEPLLISAVAVFKDSLGIKTTKRVVFNGNHNMRHHLLRLSIQQPEGSKLISVKTRRIYGR